MTSKFTEVAIDCADPHGLTDGVVTIGSPMVAEGENHLGPVPPTLTFAHVREPRPSRTRSTSTSTQPTGSKAKRSVACST